MDERWTQIFRRSFCKGTWENISSLLPLLLQSMEMLIRRVCSVQDNMARTNDPNEYVVHDPLLEKGKEKFNRMQAKLKRREREWAGKSMTWNLRICEVAWRSMKGSRGFAFVWWMCDAFDVWELPRDWFPLWTNDTWACLILVRYQWIFMDSCCMSDSFFLSTWVFLHD